MKRNLLTVCAVVLAIAFSAFSVKSTNYYMTFIPLSTVEKSLSSFTYSTNLPSHVNDGVGQINWFKVIDDNGTAGVQQVEFDRDFEIYDVASDSDNKLSDESGDISNELDLKLPPL